MPDDDNKQKRAAEIDKAIREHDAKKRDDENVDVGRERAAGGGDGEHLDKMLTAWRQCRKSSMTLFAGWMN